MGNTFEPSPEEIRAMCAEIRRGWSDETRQSRQVCEPRPWQVPGADRNGEVTTNRTVED